MAIFGPKAWVNTLGKMSIFPLFRLLVIIAQKGAFSSQNIKKDIFLCYIAQKKKVGKMAIFGGKPCVDPLGKMSILRLFRLLVFTAQKGVFSFQNIIKHIFLPYIAKKKESWKNGHFWTKTMGQPLSKNVNFWTFWTSCFYRLERRFFVLEYHKTHFPALYCLKKKSWKYCHFWTKTMG